MAEPDVGSDRILLHGSQEDASSNRVRQERTRVERWERARTAAAGLMRRAHDEASSEDGVVLRALMLLAEAVQAGHLYLTVLAPATEEARIYRARRKRPLRDHRRAQPAVDGVLGGGGDSNLDGCNATLEVLHAETREILTIRPVVLGAEVSFHALLYPNPTRGTRALGCLSAFGSQNLNMTPDNVALIDAMGEHLASTLIAEPVPA